MHGKPGAEGRSAVAAVTALAGTRNHGAHAVGIDSPNLPLPSCIQPARTIRCQRPFRYPDSDFGESMDQAGPVDLPNQPAPPVGNEYVPSPIDCHSHRGLKLRLDYRTAITTESGIPRFRKRGDDACVANLPNAMAFPVRDVNIAERIRRHAHWTNPSFSLGDGRQRNYER